MLCLCISSVRAQFRISSPIDKAVYQRSPNAAFITIAGQAAFVPCSAGSFVEYRIYNINLQNGYAISTLPSYSSVSTDARGRYFFTQVIGTGWYQFEVRAVNSSGQILYSNSLKFGVGDIYIIAGQSNAQSLGLGDRSIGQQTPTTVQSGDITYEAVVSNNYTEYCQMGGGKMPRFPVFSTLASGTTSALGNSIAPNGYSNWCYTRLGNRLAEQGIPVAFFNAAFGGSSIRTWYDSRGGGSQFCFTGPVAGEPYATLKKCLNYYGSLFGVRAVLWHQGEADNKNITQGKQNPDVTQNEYTYDLIALINQSRTDFGSQLSWVVSKTSWNEGQADSRITDAQADVLAGLNPSFSGSPSRTDNSALSFLPILGVVTDNYDNSYRIDLTNPLDKVHFNNNQDPTTLVGIDGLRFLGDLWKNILPLSSGTPISSSSIQDITVTKSGSSFTLTAPSGYSSYYWVKNTDRLDNPFSTSSSITVSDDFSEYRCFLKKSNGNFELTASAIGKSLCANNRIGSSEPDFSGTEEGIALRSFPNPSTNDFTIEFNVPFEAEFAKVDLTNMAGEVVKIIAQGSFAKGHFTYPMVGKELPTGTYICRLLINDTTYSTKLIKLGN